MSFLEFLKKRWLVLLIAVLVLAGGVFAAVTFLGGEQEETASDDEDEDDESESVDKPIERIRLNLSALLTDKAGVNTESGFKLTFPKGLKLDARVVQEALKVTPPLDYALEKADDGLVIKPKAFLQANKVYTFSINLPEQKIKETWAFQTRREFKIISSLPADRATDVPLNSGIEITFSHTNIQDFEKNFSIEPKVDGRFEMHKNIAVFVPKALEADTIYTVTIAKDVLQADSGEALKEDYSFSFQTRANIQPKNNEPYLSVYNWLYNFPSDFQPVFDVGASDDLKGKDIEVSIYRYNDADTFIKDYDATNERPSWATIDRNRYMPDISALTPFKKFVQPLTYIEDSYYMAYLPLPENLPEGHYLLVMKSGELQDYAFVQVNDMQLYMSIGDDMSLLWANDMISGQPVAGARFEGNGIASVTTSPDGTALVTEDIYKNNAGRTVCFKVSRDGHPTLVAPVYNGSSYWNTGLEADYKSNWSTLYLDRSTYLPTDTVKVWGVLRPRSGAASPRTIRVNLVDYVYDYSTYSSNKQILDSREVSLTSRGSYEAEFAFENLPEDGYNIEVVSEGVTVSTSYFYVNKYIKSQYVVSVNPEYKAYFTGETFRAEIGCEFFEGTPVSGYEMDYFIRSYSDYRDMSSGSLTIDTQGKADISIDIPEDASKPMSWSPVYHSLNVNNKNPEETEIHENAYFYVYPRDVMTETEIDCNNGTADITFKTNLIDLSQVRETGEVYGEGEDPLYKGAPVDRLLKVTLYERYWDRRENGEYYDMISKQNVKTYEYFEVKNALNTFDVQTVGGIANHTLNIPDYSDKKLYTIAYETVDTKSRPITEEAYLTDYDDYWYGYGYYENDYHLDFEDEDNSYKVGEAISFSLKKNDKAPITSGNILYMVLKEGIDSFWTSQNASQSISFTEDYIPNVYIQAVYFDGRQIHSAYERLVRFDYSDKELDITLETDKESYKPGETVNAEITVRDKAGSPTEADVNLSVVDEAYFALYQQEVDTAGSLYRSVFDPGIKNTYISYIPNTRGQGGAEGGEGEDEGGRNVRRNFVDTAFFEALETDENGKARISFKLPDNLTSWRLTYQAFTDDIKAGNGKMNITTRLPFFVKAVMNDTYMAGDAPKILIKGYGEGVQPGDEISFRLTLKGINDAQIFEGKGKAGEYTEIALPALNEGIYTLTTEGTKDNLFDAVENTIQVRKSLLTAKQVDYHTLTPDLKLEGIDGYATLSFYNADLNDFFTSLQNLYWSWGNRLDQIVARNISQELLKQFFEDDYYTYGEKADISSYQKEDGGFALLPYGSSDVELSAKIAALCPDDVNGSLLSSYFHGIINDTAATPLQVSAAFYGLASLREPVLLELQSFMEAGDMTLDENLYLANALAVLGDIANAEKLYKELSKSYGKEMEPYRYLDGNGDKDDILRWTSLMAILAVEVDAQDKMSYFKYIEQNSPDEILINIERLILVRQGLPFVSRDSSFAIEIDGKKETIRLEGTKPVSMMLSPEKLRTLKFSGIKGNIALSVSYEAAKDPTEANNPIATVKRTYNKSSSVPVTINRTDLVTIELDVAFSEAAPEGFYEVTDVLPSGLRYIYPYQADVDEWYFGNPDGQRVKLGLYYDGEVRQRNIVYYARVSAPGDYTADYAMVKHSESDSCGYSQRTSITIR